MEGNSDQDFYGIKNNHPDQSVQMNSFNNIQLESEENKFNRLDSDQDDPSALLNKERQYIPKYAGVQAANGMRPTGIQISQAMGHLDLAVKSEMFMYDMQSGIFWASVFELAIFILGFILFCAVPELMSFIWLHIFHIPRGILGFCLLKSLPRSHQILDRLTIPDNHYSFQQLIQILKEQISRIFLDYAESCKKLLLGYCILTIIAIFFDFIEFIIQFIRFGRDGDEHSELSMLLITLLFLALDFFYLVWVIQVKEKFPSDISSAITKALFGFASTMTVYLHKNITDVKFGQPIKNKIMQTIQQKRQQQTHKRQEEQKREH